MTHMNPGGHRETQEDPGGHMRTNDNTGGHRRTQKDTKKCGQYFHTQKDKGNMDLFKQLFFLNSLNYIECVN